MFKSWLTWGLNMAPNIETLTLSLSICKEEQEHEEETKEMLLAADELVLPLHFKQVIELSNRVQVINFCNNFSDVLQGH